MKYVVDIAGELPSTGALRNAKRMSVTDALQDIAGEICDSYCKYPSMCKTERELDEKYCDSCPLNNL